MRRTKMSPYWVLWLAMAGSAAGAMAGPISDPVFTITASNAEGTGSFAINFVDLTYNAGTGVYKYAPTSAIDLGDSGASILQLNLEFLPTTTVRRITMNFQGISGESNTTFTIRTGLMSFIPLVASLARGKATVTFGCTDLNQNGASLTALTPPVGNGIYKAHYNGLVPGGTQFCNLLNSITAGPGGSNSTTINDPLTGWRYTNAAVSSMSVENAFVLSGGDRMSGQTQFVMTPEPAGIGLLVLITMLLAGRRR